MFNIIYVNIYIFFNKNKKNIQCIYKLRNSSYVIQYICQLFLINNNKNHIFPGKNILAQTIMTSICTKNISFWISSLLLHFILKIISNITLVSAKTIASSGQMYGVNTFIF